MEKQEQFFKQDNRNFKKKNLKLRNEKLKSPIKSKSKSVHKFEHKDDFEKTSQKVFMKSENKSAKKSLKSNDQKFERKSAVSFNQNKTELEMIDIKNVYQILLTCKQTIENLKRENLLLLRENRNLKTQVFLKDEKKWRE